MKMKKMYLILVSIITLTTLVSWSPLSSASRQLTSRQDFLDYLENRQEKHQKKQRAKIERHFNTQKSKLKNKLGLFADQDGYIWFDDKSNPYTFFLSNFYPGSIQIWGMNFRCAESAFQAAKFLHNPKLAARFTKLDGKEAWELAQKKSYQQRQDWYSIRETIMVEILRAKFKQNAELADLLLSTGDAYLVEHTKRDSFWADGGDGKGKNRLGTLLMAIRGEIGGIGPVSKPKRYREFVK